MVEVFIILAGVELVASCPELIAEYCLKSVGACSNIVGYIGVGTDEGASVVKKQKKESCYLVQEYMNGGSLKAKIWRQVWPRNISHLDLRTNTNL